ncbi:MAG: hypothetical protein U1E69_21980 [Tabrizicola sp.]|uniref:hypothetical protein n=1 Tax=Tabrizicola sp. TaxID=2005166 RepID=UPI002AB80D45|nr:hypothetical protein [Tabrizicola sp.]MDZ4089467.1 hypothetical protein [Tabrizicola sp.]
MSLHDPVILAQDFAAAMCGPQTDDLPPLGDLRHRLLEAGSLDCCAEGDFLALMPSVHAPAPPWSDDRTWLRRILGF